MQSCDDAATADGGDAPAAAESGDPEFIITWLGQLQAAAATLWQPPLTDQQKQALLERLSDLLTSEPGSCELSQATVHDRCNAALRIAKLLDTHRDGPAAAAAGGIAGEGTDAGGSSSSSSGPPLYTAVAGVLQVTVWQACPGWLPDKGSLTELSIVRLVTDVAEGICNGGGCSGSCSLPGPA